MTIQFVVKNNFPEKIIWIKNTNHLDHLNNAMSVLSLTPQCHCKCNVQFGPHGKMKLKTDL